MSETIEILNEVEELWMNETQIENRQKYKDSLKFINSKKFIKILDEYKEESLELLKDIHYEYETREEAKLEVTWLDELVQYKEHLEEVIEVLSKDELAKYIVEELEKQVNNSITHIDWRVEIWFDAPTYTKLDKLKLKRNLCVTLEKRINEIVNSFNDQKEEKIDTHPYED